MYFSNNARLIISTDWCWNFSPIRRRLYHLVGGDCLRQEAPLGAIKIKEAISSPSSQIFESVCFKILYRDNSHKGTSPFESSKASVMCLVSVVYSTLLVGVTDVQLYNVHVCSVTSGVICAKERH